MFKKTENKSSSFFQFKDQPSCIKDGALMF